LPSWLPFLLFLLFIGYRATW